jgi:hypothetical protein
MSLAPICESLHKIGSKKVAIDMLEAFYRVAFHFEEYDDLAKSAFKIKEYVLAIKYGNDALTNALTNEKMFIARANLINLYNHANYPEKAMRLIKAQEAILPDNVDNQLEKSFSHFLLAERDEAEAILRATLLRTDITEEMRTKIMFNLGTYEMYRDNFLYGLELFQIEGQRLNYWTKPKLAGVQWIGQPVNECDSKDILVYAEAGIGDELINVRFLKHLKDKGFNPIWFTQRADLKEIFEYSGFTVISNMNDRPADSMWTYSMTLPLYLNLEYKDLWKGAYIKPNPKYKVRYDWDGAPKPKIGIRWQGNPEYDHDLHRSVPLNELVDAIPRGTKLISIQRDTGLEELKMFPKIIDMSPSLKTFNQTLDIIDNLDIVITTCTSVAHAAAAMGKRTFIFVPISAYYLWSHSMKQSPWYGSNVTLLRQVKPRCWKAPMAELKEYLECR